MSANASLYEYLSDATLAIGIAIVGGLARVLQSKEPLTFRFVSQGLITSAFCGIVVTLVLGEYGLSQLMRSAGIAMSGWAGPVLLPYATAQSKRLIDRFFGGGGPYAGT